MEEFLFEQDAVGEPEVQSFFGVAPAEGVSFEERRAGELIKDTGSYGFIKQDGFEENMFILPNSCQAFGGQLPPLGTRITYGVVTDAKTGRERAEDVQPEGAGYAAGYSAAVPSSSMHGARGAEDASGLQAGTMMKDNGNFGFIEQDAGGDNMFVIPNSCEAFGKRLPPAGTRVLYSVVMDAKTGRPRAEGVVPEGQGSFPPPQMPRFSSKGKGKGKGKSEASWGKGKPAGKGGPAWAPPPQMALGGGEATGTIIKSSGSYGFIQQDSGGDNMFAIPSASPGFGGVLPPVGTRVAYSVVADAKTGRPRAEDMRPLEEAAAPPGPPAWHQPPSSPRQWAAAAAPPQAAGMHTGTIVAANATFGFIEQDAGGDNMFVIPSSCESFGKVIPPQGTRVAYAIVTDSKTGRLRADAVQLEGPGGGAYVGGGGGALDGRCAGTVTKVTGQYGFIQQDSGGDNMFVIPSSCEAFGKAIPPVGTRVVYSVVADEKTGRPRAEVVEPETPFGHGPCYGKAGGAKGWGKGKGKGGGKRSHPYAAALPY